MLYRFELDYLTTWLHRSNRKPLLIRGARQVGKSTLVRLLAQKESKQLIELDFESNPDLAELFKSQDPKTILSLLSVQLGQNIQPESIILFLDELQKTPQILGTLRYFYEKMPECAVIATGSLLDLTLNDIQFSVPVGRIEYLYLMPMSFEAFLIAVKKSHLVEFLTQYQLSQNIPAIIHQSLLNEVKRYFIIGGLPEAIVQYITTESFLDVERVKKSLLIGYQDDFAKYASVVEQERMRLIFNKIPRMLGEKFKYSQIDPDQKSTTLKSALCALNLARIIHIAYHTDANGLPLGAEINAKKFKTYFLDIGLVASALDLNILNFEHVQDFTLVNAGKMAEQFMAQVLLQFRELYEPPNLYYWLREKKSAAAEVDFVIPFHGKVIPIEVKAGSTGTLKSLHYFLSEKNLNLGVRVCNQLPSIHSSSVQVHNATTSFQLLTLPFYLTGQLRRLLETI